ncbi:glutathione S-transferase family protein [Halopseudomonas pelagia]|uniref:glutathione S-transferase family protein n=1 Tax=Halopseudomonas pelagia TaxID=553151 RepID=UPI001E2E34B2|nr:glutathione S-transferase family protein [Halopseudomonas pelagia]
MTTELFIANKNYSSWSLRPWVLMRQLEIPFTERLMPFSGADTAASYRAFSPSAKVPCLVDGEARVWDSLAIVEYLAETRSGVWPEELTARTWARCAAAEMHSGFTQLRNICTMNCGLRIQLHEVAPALQAELTRLDELWCEGIGRFGGHFLAGKNFTAVDAFFAPVAFRLQTYNLQLSVTAMEYVARLLMLEPMREWYDAALREPWRDDPHEQDAARVGTWLDDLRG